MRKACGVEIKSDPQFLRPVDPALEMPDLDLIAVHFLPFEVTVHGMKVQPLLPREKAHHLFDVLPQLADGPCLARGVARRHNTAAAQDGICPLKSADIV